MNQEDAQIVSKLESFVKISRDTTDTLFGTSDVNSIIRAPNHYKHVDVVIDDLPENQCCTDVVVMQQIQILIPGSNKKPEVLQNLSCRVLKIRKGMKIAHVEASSVVLSLVTSQLSENVPEKVAGNSPKSNLLKSLHEGNHSRLEKHFESLNLKGIESWDEQQQQSARDLMTEFQNLFPMNLSELGKASLVQHDIKLDDMMSFKEQY